jgi:hypothetical protein
MTSKHQESRSITRLTDTQLIILSEAAQRPDGTIAIPERLKGNAGAPALKSLLRRKMIEKCGDESLQASGDQVMEPRYRISEAGLKALGISDASPPESKGDLVAKGGSKRKSKTSRAEARSKRPKRGKSGASSKEARRAPRGKQADLIALLSRAKGATLDDLMSATGWQAHSVRGFLSGTVKARLGLKLDRMKDAKRGSVYRIPT